MCGVHAGVLAFVIGWRPCTFPVLLGWPVYGTLFCLLQSVDDDPSVAFFHRRGALRKWTDHALGFERPSKIESCVRRSSTGTAVSGVSAMVVSTGTRHGYVLALQIGFWSQ